MQLVRNRLCANIVTVCCQHVKTHSKTLHLHSTSLKHHAKKDKSLKLKIVDFTNYLLGA